MTDRQKDRSTTESLRTRLLRLGYNFFPAYRGTGGRITFIASDSSEVRVRIPLNWRTRNYVGTIFGGSMFGAVDPIYMVMLIKRLGKDYIVWDKAGKIDFKKPGRTELRATFRLTNEDLSELRRELETAATAERTYRIELKDTNNNVCAVVERLVHIRKRQQS